MEVSQPSVNHPEQDSFYFKKDSKVLEKISARNGIPIPELQKEFVKRTKLIYSLYQRKIFGFDEMKKIINDYYKNPEIVLKQYGIE